MTSRVLVISYHYLRSKEDIPHPGIHPLTPESFLRQIHSIQQNHPVLSPSQFETWMDGSSADASSVLLTFDDGLRDHLYAAAELEKSGLRGAFFVCSRPALDNKALPVHKVHWLRAHTPPGDFLNQFAALLSDDWQQMVAQPPEDIQRAAAETYQFDAPDTQVLKYLINFVLPYECVDEITSRLLVGHGLDEVTFCALSYLTNEEIHDLSRRGHLIGCHGHLHLPFSRLAPGKLQEDVAKNKAYIHNITGTQAGWLAYPYGSDWSLPADTGMFAARAGIRAAFTYTRGWNTPSTPRHRLCRIDCNELEAHLTAC